VQQSHDATAEALRQVSAAVLTDWRRGSVERSDLPRFMFDPEDLIVVVGQDGLTELTQCIIDSGQALRIVIENDSLVVLGDGLESDYLAPLWGAGHRGQGGVVPAQPCHRPRPRSVTRSLM
jgi:hypothetical protein